MLLGHASRIRAGMNGDNMMRIKWGQSCNTTQLTLPSLRPWSRCPVDTAQVSQESPDWLSERRGERELTLNRKYPRHVIRSHRLQSCVMVIVLYQRRSLHILSVLLSSVLISPVEISSRWLWVILAPESWARIAPGAQLGQDKDRPGLAAAASVGCPMQSQMENVKASSNLYFLRWKDRGGKWWVMNPTISAHDAQIVKYIEYIAMAVTCSSETIGVTWYSLRQSCLLNLKERTKPRPPYQDMKTCHLSL